MRHGRAFRRGYWLPAAAATVIALAAAASGRGSGIALAGYPRPAEPARAAAVAPASELALMRAAAREFHVPERLLLALSYTETHWSRSGTAPSADGGYGLMDLTARSVPAPDARGIPGPRTVTLRRTHYTLDEAARLLHLPTAELQRSERQNIRGAAALLAGYARKLSGGSLPVSLNGWYGAVADYSGAPTAQAARLFADSVFQTLGTGAALTTPDRQHLALAATPGLRPDRGQLGQLALRKTAATATPAPDCPAGLSCSFVPAAYQADSATDPANYGNYDKAARPDGMQAPAGQPASMKIDYIIVHDTEGSYAGAISAFQDPASYVSANYVVKSSNGAVTEMVPPGDVSWGAGDWYINMHAINIENEGYAQNGRSWYTPALYKSTSALVRYLAAKYRIPLDRTHILGHEDVPGPTTYYTSVQHWDPGPFWNWNHFMALVHGKSDAAERASGGAARRGKHRLVTIDPVFAINKPTVTACAGCRKLPGQPANFVYLRTGPGAGYPLVADRILHPGAKAGTTADSDWGDKATIGETFVFAGQKGSWTAIWYGGRKAWFANPGGTHQAALYRGGQVITPRPGRKSIPVYGAAYPEASAYPAAVTPMTVSKLAYTIGAGQYYPLAARVPADYYYAATWNSSLTDDHTVIIGSTPYYEISFNHRKFFVQASDVTVHKLP